jgi:hypothetical protein
VHLLTTIILLYYNLLTAVYSNEEEFVVPVTLTLYVTYNEHLSERKTKIKP